MAERKDAAMRWILRHAPSRDQLAKSRWFPKFVLRPALWRFTRRSVPRGVFVGLLVGIFLMLPGLQMIGAALLSVPLRANVPIAAALTFLSNPATTPFFFAAAIAIGNRFGYHADVATFRKLAAEGATWSDWAAWLASDAAPAALLGLALIALGAALLGYIIADLGWRLLQLRRWRRRRSPNSPEHIID